MRNNFDRVVLLSNPVSTRTETIHRAVDKIHAKLGARVIGLNTFPDVADTISMLDGELRIGDLLVPVGGDGTARAGVQALSNMESPAHGAVLLPLPGGYRNDLAHQLHIRQALRDPVQALETAEVQTFMPMSVRVETDYTVTERVAALYMGVGAIAAGAAYQSSDEHRLHWMYRHGLTRELHSLRLLPWTLKHTEPFEIETEDGDTRTLFDATVSKVSILAKYLHPPVSIDQDYAAYMEVASKSLGDVVPYVGRLMTYPHVQAPKHETIMPGQSMRFMVRDDVLLQTDGDVWPVLSGSVVTFGMHTAPYQALTTRSTLQTK